MEQKIIKFSRWIRPKQESETGPEGRMALLRLTATAFQLQVHTSGYRAALEISASSIRERHLQISFATSRTLYLRGAAHRQGMVQRNTLWKHLACCINTPKTLSSSQIMGSLWLLALRKTKLRKMGLPSWSLPWLRGQLRFNGAWKGMEKTGTKIPLDSF